MYREERFRLDGEREELQTIRRELSALRDLGLSLNQASSEPGPGVPYPSTNQGVGANNKENVGVSSGWMGAFWSSPHGGGKPTMATTPPPKVMEATRGITTPELEERLAAGGGRGEEERRGEGRGHRAAQEEEEEGEGSELWRLRRERADLMATGLYEDGHPIIRELSRLIEASATRGGGHQH